MSLYNSLYTQNIRKLLKSKGKTLAVMGHTHIPSHEKDFIIIGTFHDGYVYEDDQVVAISDVHLGTFDYSKEKLEKLKSILNQSDKQVLLMGDFFDLFYTKPSDMLNRYKDFIELIKERQKEANLIYISGNHDWNVTPLLGIPSVREYVVEDKIFFHGQACDPLYVMFPFNAFQFVRMRLSYRLRFLKSFYIKFRG